MHPLIKPLAIAILALLSAGCLKPDADGDGYADKIDAYPDSAYAHEKSWWGDHNLKYGNEPPEHNAFYEM